MARKTQITAKVLKISNPQGWLACLYQGKGKKPYQKHFADQIKKQQREAYSFARREKEQKHLTPG